MRLRAVTAIAIVAILTALGARSAAPVKAVDGAYFACASGSGYLSGPDNAVPVNQGQTITIPIAIHRTDCADEISVDLYWGMPAGAQVSFSPNPTTGDTITVTVKTTTATPVGGMNLSLSVQTGHNYPGLYLALGADVKPAIAPVEAAPRSSLVNGSVIGTTTTPVRTTWSATDPDGVARYALQRSIDGGAWTNVTLPSATTKSLTQSLTFGHRYQYRARATDKLGHVSAWVAARAFVPKRYQQTLSSFSSPWHWTTVSTSAASGGSLKYQPYSGSEFSVTLTGMSVAWVTVAGPNRTNTYNVYMDGADFGGNRSLNRSSVQYRRIGFVANFASDTRHTYRVLNLGMIGHCRIDVDAFVVLDQQ
jgi:hypothetical protein